jgi:hypothetical protein
MENTCAKTEVKNDLFVRIKATKSPKINVPGEQSDKIIMVAVEVNEERTEIAEIFDLNIHIQSSAEIKLTKADSGKTA